MALFAFSMAAWSNFNILDRPLHLRVGCQIVEETESALCPLDGHLRPKARRISLGSAEIGDTLLDQGRDSFQAAQQICRQIVGRTHS